MHAMAYTAPTATDLKTMYPAFASVADATVDAYIVRANRSVDATWTEDDYADAIMLLACHLMALNGIGSSNDAKASGFATIKSGNLTLTRERATAGGTPDPWSRTVYGVQFYTLLRQNKAAGGLAATDDTVDLDGWNPALPYPAAWAQ